MADLIRSCHLKSGERMDVLRVAAPCGDWADRICDFMYVRHPEYTNCSWHHDCRRIVAGDYETVSNDVFFMGMAGGEIAGTTWYATAADSGELGTFGRVVTAVSQRRKGISTVLSQMALDDFRAHGGTVMHLGTSLRNPAHLIYEAIGYRDINSVPGNGTVMRWSDPETDFPDGYYAPGRPISRRTLHHGDLARVEALVNLPHWFMKDYSLGVCGSTPFEGQFFDLMAWVDRGEVGEALVTDQGRLVGLAYTAPTAIGGGAQDHVRVLECLVHPSYAGEEAGLVRVAADAARASKLLSHASSGDTQKCAALEEAGFEREAVLRGALQDEAGPLDLVVYSLGK